MAGKITLQDLQLRLWSCAEILRGSAVDRTDWKAYILPEGKRLTETNLQKFSAATPLYPSGLIGPVAVLQAGPGMSERIPESRPRPRSGRPMRIVPSSGRRRRPCPGIPRSSCLRAFNPRHREVGYDQT